MYDDMTTRALKARLKAKASPKAKAKAKAKPTPETGVDKIIAHLVKHKDQIGAIVVGVAPKPYAHITAPDGDTECDGLQFAADVTVFDGHEGAARRTMMTRGLVVTLANVHLDKRGPLG